MSPTEQIDPQQTTLSAVRPGGKASTAYGATMLLMGSSLLSAVLGLVRVKYIAAVFGADHTTDAYTAAFQLPDMISYFLVGGGQASRCSRS